MAGRDGGYRQAVRETTDTLAERYVLGPVLGHGGMATVHEARDLVLDRPVAVKVLSPPFDRDRGFVERFRREASSVARLNHPNVVAVYDSGSDGERHFIVTELVDGETLAAAISRDGTPSVEASVDVARQIARALAAAHDAGVVHRDVKPGNVMLTVDGRVKVVDFGIAKAAGAGTLTLSGALLGSAPYLSPEQARGDPVDERTDLYSLGCVLYEMLTGRPPFLGDSPVATLYQHANEPPEPPSSVRPVPAGLEGIVMRCLEKRPERRFGSAAELDRALGAADVSTAVGTEEPTDTLPLPVVSAEAGTAPTSGTTPTAPLRPARGAAGRWSRDHAVVTAGVVAAAIGIAAVAVAVLDERDPFPPPGASVRQTGGASPASSPTVSPDGVTTTTDVGAGVPAAFDDLVQVIDGGGVPPDVASKLHEHAARMYEHYEEGNLDHAGREAEKILHELEKRVERGEVSEDSALEIAAALDVFLDAVDASPPPEDGEDDEDGGD